MLQQQSGQSHMPELVVTLVAVSYAVLEKKEWSNSALILDRNPDLNEAILKRVIFAPYWTEGIKHFSGNFIHSSIIDLQLLQLNAI